MLNNVSLLDTVCMECSVKLNENCDDSIYKFACVPLR